ncbi:Integral membrane protein SED5 [Lachancea thermotolerans]|uniref:KLTH0D04246p n=1 Tax=Lachancea thermotolerans (strain ATCC 56472 / CBS 6340 / NRRL Y-8284) TaxID=559295 RepID=C5DGC7_LACTC|nr:KLTH0D04246p [Lachancea thermotolerans CBS 6340]CAR22469.1 KLTH0D04246p [Lachancea thermotolerans CBS 6340]
MDIRNRTTEFQRSVFAYSKRNGGGAPKPAAGDAAARKSEFQQKASTVAHEIAQTAQLLAKLAQLAKRKPMLNDNPVEIAELTYVIKRKIYSVEQSMLELSRLGGKPGAPLPAQHSKNVMNLLNTKMKNISGDFKSVLEQRQRLEATNRDRWEKLSAQTDDEKARSPQVQQTYNSSNPFMSSVLEESPAGGSEAQLALPQDSSMLLLEEQNASSAYLQERSRAVETIESTIQEVGNLFQQLAHMVQEQGEVIQRIDANVDDIDVNISGAQRELLKYFDRVSSNRWLAVKIFAVLFVFFLVWVLVN